VGISSLSQAQATTPPGLVLITTSSFSAVSSVSVDGCFTSEHDDYRILLSGYASGTTSVQMRMRASGADASGATDYGFSYGVWGSTAARTPDTSGMVVAVFTVVDGSASSIDVSRPFLAKPTVTSSTGYRADQYGIATGGGHKVAASYDGFTLFPSTGTFTGTLRVYGYRKAV
jgi:hypothetical protein